MWRFSIIRTRGSHCLGKLSHQQTSKALRKASVSKGSGVQGLGLEFGQSSLSGSGECQNGSLQRRV